MKRKQTVFITGTSLGIGRATAKYFLGNGWNVVATMRKPEEEKEFVMNESLLVLPVDVSNSDSIRLAFQKGVEKFGSIDVIVNNAGYGLLGPLELTTEEQVKEQFETNVFGTINVSRVAIAHFRAQNKGTIINVSSMLGKITLPFMSMYVATKFAIEGLSEDLFYELKKFNIQVKLIEPGTINTNFFTTSVRYAENTNILAYDSYWQKVKANLSKRGREGEDPVVAARVIYTAATDGRSKVRYTVDKTAKLLIFLRKISPLSLFRFIVGITVK